MTTPLNQEFMSNALPATPPTTGPLLNGYRKLTEQEQALANEVSRIGDYVELLIAKLTAASAVPGAIDQRALAIGRTDLQTGFMWLKRAVTKPTTFA
jgi:hypothetical protein